MPGGRRNTLPVPLTVTALVICAGQLTHVQGSRHHGLSWQLSLGDALAAIASGRYSLGMRSGRERVTLVHRSDLARRFEALDRDGKDLVLELPVITCEVPGPQLVDPEAR